MGSSIMTILAAAAGSVGAYFAWKNSSFRQRQLVEKQVEEEEAKAKEAKEDIEAAVYGKDDAKVNEIVAGLLD